MSNMLESYGQPEGLPGKESAPSPEIDFDEIFAETPPQSPEDLERSRAAKMALEESFGSYDKHGDPAVQKALAQEKRAKLLKDIHGNT